MKLLKISLFCTMTISLLSAPAAAQSAPAKPAVGFEQLKSLAGEWQGKSADGQAVHVLYQIVSGGTALMERLSPAKEPEMMTMYSADGNRVAVTHYCSTNTQPQMKTQPISSPMNEFAFSFVSATNLSGPDSGHMDSLVLVLDDVDHLTQRWTWKQKGQTKIEVFHLTRVTQVL